MADKFEHFRLSLMVRPQADLFDSNGSITREEYLRRIFAQPRTFDHYSSTYHYVPRNNDFPQSPIFGRIGRKVRTEENLPPDEDFTEITHVAWQAIVTVLDPTDHEDGQKIAVEVKPAVGGSSALIKALVAAINSSDPFSAFLIEVQPIFDPSEFWRWAEENRGRVTSVKFDLVAPNGLFGARNNLREELKAANEQSGATEVVIELKSEDGLDLDTPPIHEAVEYAKGTGGRILGRAKGNKRFSSTSRPKTTTLKDGDDAGEPLIVRAARHIAEILGR